MSDLVLDQPLRPLLELVGVRHAALEGAAGGGLTCGFDARSIAALIGITGAGREALGRLITGRALPAAGAIRFGGLRIDRLGEAARVGLGIAGAWRRRPLGPGSVAEWLADARAVVGHGWWRQAFAVAIGPSAEERRSIAAILAFLEIEHLATRPAAGLAGVEARLVDLARCLAQRPRLLLLEHPLAGLGAEDRALIVRCLERLRDAELALIVIDDDLATLSGLADRCLVLHHGRLIGDGTPAAIGRMPHVFRALTGSDL